MKKDKQFTPDQIKTLEEFENLKHWHSLKFTQVILNIPRAAIDAVVSVYEEYYEKRSTFCLHCPVDQCRLLETVYQQYERIYPDYIKENVLKATIKVTGPNLRPGLITDTVDSLSYEPQTTKEAQEPAVPFENYNTNEAERAKATSSARASVLNTLRKSAVKNDPAPAIVIPPGTGEITDFTPNNLADRLEQMKKEVKEGDRSFNHAFDAAKELVKNFMETDPGGAPSIEISEKANIRENSPSKNVKPCTTKTKGKK
jgi:hypothetical protein